MFPLCLGSNSLLQTLFLFIVSLFTAKKGYARLKKHYTVLDPSFRGRRTAYSSNDPVLKDIIPFSAEEV